MFSVGGFTLCLVQSPQQGVQADSCLCGTVLVQRTVAAGKTGPTQTGDVGLGLDLNVPSPKGSQP